MTPFTTHTGKVVPLLRDNIDTDVIIPKQFMKSIARTGFGPYLFDAWRYKDDGYYGKPLTERVPDEAFVLNDPRYRDGTILLAGKNFGCGSSREHAPWALYQYGFRVLIATSFADIFYNNCCKNGLLPVVADAEQMFALQEDLRHSPELSLTVDLVRCQVGIAGTIAFTFTMPDGLRRGLIDGTDEVAVTLAHADLIRHYEQERLASRPWL